MPIFAKEFKLTSMKKTGLWMMCGALALMLSACSTKQSAVNDLEKLSYELRDHSRYYSVNDWEKAGEKFVKITKQVKKHEGDYTPEEKTRIGQLEGECVGYMTRGAVYNTTDRLRSIYNEVRGILDGLDGVFK